MKDNTIKENSIGLQAGRDLTVQHTVNELPESMQNMFLEILKPSVEQIGENLKNEISSDVSKSIGMRIRTVLEEGFVKSIREQIKEKNLNYHIEMVFKKIHEDDKSKNRSKEEIHKTLEKMDLFLEWVESAEDISPKDSALSKIWQNWLYELSQSRDSSNHKILLGKMKQLTAEDAEILLRHRRNSISNHLSIKLNGDEKSKYIIKKLNDIGLLKRLYNFEIITLIIPLIAIWLFFNIVLNNTLASEISKFEMPLYLVCLVLPIFFYFNMPLYKLTWIGKQIVSYSYQEFYSLRSDSLENFKNEGVSKEVLKKIKILRYNKYYTENEFTEALLKQISRDELEKHKEIFLKYSKRTKK